MFLTIAPSLRSVVLLLGVIVLTACGGKADTNGEKPIPVTTRAVETSSAPIVLEAVGRTEGSKEVEIRARVSGIVQKHLYSEGSFVRAGAPLFQIERAPFEIALAQAKAAAEQAEATNDQARREADRLGGLLANAAVSKRVAEEAATAYRSATAALAAARAAVREAELNLSYTSVVAPIAGVTGRALHSEGSLVTANTDSSLLTTVSQTHPIWVRFALSEAQHYSLRAAGDEKNVVELALANGQTYSERGRLNFAGSTVDQSLGTVQLRAEFPNPQLQILPGQFATVRLDAGTQQVITVPQTAVLQGNQGRFVWTVGADGKAAQRPVEVGDWVGQEWIIRKGLNDGDIVILDNLMKLNPGVAVVAQA
ncbi:MAG TPA: efflux RND transporter periplasmic adaptor subunit, partial [Steroidobacteraceae bacterium]|nr:efflux RND transporter periplasmic adaptor subunit [Steroidobacteraceae bacterium]